jgi:hypothetical protein
MGAVSDVRDEVTIEARIGTIRRPTACRSVAPMLARRSLT